MRIGLSLAGSFLIAFLIGWVAVSFVFTTPITFSDKKEFDRRFLNLKRHMAAISEQGAKKDYKIFEQDLIETSCVSNEEFRTIWTIRSRLSRFVHALDMHRDQQGFDDLVRERNPAILALWFRYIRESNLVTEKDLSNGQTRLFLSTLLNYYHKIIEVPDWQKKMREIHRQASRGHHMNSGLAHLSPWSKDKRSPFHKAGFPKPENACFLAEGYTNVPVDTWLYSFWMRRDKERSFVLAKEAIEWLLRVQRGA